MDHLLRALNGDREIALDVAALDLAAIETPGLSPADSLRELDRMAAEIASRLRPDRDGPAFIRSMNQYLFREQGFAGNESDYYNPRNSCLNLVIETRLGIPITLSLVYMEVARRLGRQVFGIGLPGHFVVQYQDRQYSTYLDPFRGGRLITEADCNEIAHDPAALRPMSNANILTRMLNNLRGAYFRRGDFAKGARVLDVLIEAFPGNAEFHKARGVARMQQRQLSAANADFQAYLKYSPDASDRSEITTQMEVIQRWLGSLN